jgi:1-acyl-sn-glycerol-3-phosphate acyltransferase
MSADMFMIRRPANKIRVTQKSRSRVRLSSPTTFCLLARLNNMHTQSGDQSRSLRETAGPIRKVLRVLRRTAATAFCICGCLVEFAAQFAAGKRDAVSRATVLHRWSRRLLRQLNISLSVEGTPPSQGLIVSNHLSYLDILVFSTAAPCVFVAKKEVRSWPGVGWIATMAGTIYIDRSRRSATRSIQPAIHGALSSGLRLVLFPEGTSSNGKQLLPFRSSLLQPAVADGAPVTAAHLHYELGDGDPSNDVCYWGDMTLAPHALKLFTKNGVRARLRFASGSQVFSGRKEAAEKLWDAVNALGSQPQARPDNSAGQTSPAALN